MNKKNKYLIIVAILIIITLLVIYNKKWKNISNYEVSLNLRQEYKYYFNKSDIPLIYYNDKENNCVYIRICTYKYGIRPIIDKTNNEIDNANLIKTIKYNTKDESEIIINKNQFEEFYAYRL